MLCISNPFSQLDTVFLQLDSKLTFDLSDEHVQKRELNNFIEVSFHFSIISLDKVRNCGMLLSSTRDKEALINLLPLSSCCL